MARSPAICWPAGGAAWWRHADALSEIHGSRTRSLYLESYALLPALANAGRRCIDCRTVSGRSAIVVCEAKPQTVPSNYRSSILGMLIHWRDEPAVDRSFRLAVPTSGCGRSPCRRTAGSSSRWNPSFMRGG